MNKLLIFLIVLNFSIAAESKEYRMVQAGKAFLGDISDEALEKIKDTAGKYVLSKIKESKISKIEIKVGDSINFINKDIVTHSIFYKKEIDFMQVVSSENKQIFNKAKEMIIRCAIHPKMKLKVIVKE